jgi:putative NADH-flavin reductase
MKLLVFGATRGTGLCFVGEALRAGHDVVAFARTPSKITIKDPKLRVVQGDVLDAASVEAAMSAEDVVIVALGVTKLSDRGDRTISLGTDNIIAAMKKKGARRIIVLSAWGSGDSAPYGGFFLNRIIRPWFLAHPYAEHELQEAALARSDLEYVVVRPGRLTNHASKKKLKGGRTPLGLEQSASRADVAAFMLSEAVDPKFAGQMIMIG